MPHSDDTNIYISPIRNSNEAHFAAYSNQIVRINQQIFERAIKHQVYWVFGAITIQLMMAFVSKNKRFIHVSVMDWFFMRANGYLCI